MKIGNKKLTWNKRVVAYSFLALVLFVVLGTSYAYFTARVKGNPQNVTATTGTMKLKISGTTDVVCSDMMPGSDCKVSFTVTNIGTLATIYEVDMIDVINGIAINTSGSIKPDINLKADVKIVSGDGTKNNPYIVE